MTVRTVTAVKQGGGAGGPNIVFGPDTVHLKDQLAAALTLMDTAHLRDLLSATVGLNDLEHLRDALTTTGTLSFTDTEHLKDVLAATLALPDKVILKDLLKANLLLPDTVHLKDALTVTATTGIKFGDSVFPSKPRLLHATFTGLQAARSGTPDTDWSGDAWTDATVGNTGLNHGNESPLVIANSVTGVRVAYLEFDFTRFANYTVFPGGTHICHINYENGGLVSVTFTAHFSTFAARPFTESTITQANQPADGGNVVNQTVVRASGASGYNSHVLTDAFITAALGNWVMVRITNDAAVSNANLGVFSREAVAAQRPNWDFELQRT